MSDPERDLSTVSANARLGISLQKALQVFSISDLLHTYYLKKKNIYWLLAEFRFIGGAGDTAGNKRYNTLMGSLLSAEKQHA